jgi:rsbT antagonist protein RsbS
MKRFDGKLMINVQEQSDYLIATVKAALTDADLTRLREALIENVERHGLTVVILDVTQLDVIDSFASKTLHDVARTIALRGAETVIVGIQPEVAFAMVQLGITLENVTIAPDLEEGLSYLERKSRHDETSRA